MLKYILIAIVTLLVPVIQCTNTTYMLHLVGPLPVCKSEICNTGVPVCGTDVNLGDTRFFVDECDMNEYNCDNKTEYVVTKSEKCFEVSITKDIANETKKTVSETKIPESTIFNTINPNITEKENTSKSATLAVTAEENSAENITATDIKSKIIITATEITFPETTNKENDPSKSTPKTTATENKVPSIVTLSTTVSTPKTTNTTATLQTISSTKQTDTTYLLTTITVTTMPETTITNNQTKCSRSLLTDSTFTSKQTSISNTIIQTPTKLIESQTPAMNTTYLTVKITKSNITYLTTKAPSIAVTTISATTTTIAYENNTFSNSEPTARNQSVGTTLAEMKVNSEVNTGGCTCSHTHPTTPELPESPETTSTKVTTTLKTTTMKSTTMKTTMKMETTHNVNSCTCTPNTTVTLPEISQNATIAETATSKTTLIEVTTPNVIQSENTLPETTESENVTNILTGKDNVTSINMPVTESVTDIKVTTVPIQKACETTYPKDCDMPVTWETTVEGEKRDFFQILRDRYGNIGRRFFRTSFFTPFPTGVLLRPKRKDKFRFGRHVESREPL